nr:ABC transporter permease [Halovivax sp. KZCA124]
MNYYVNRTVQALITIYAVVTLSFVLIRFMPGGPVDYLRAQMAQEVQTGEETVDPAQVNALVETYTNVSPDEPIWEQYISYMTSVFTGDFGVSIWYQMPVADIIAAAIPWTVFIMSASLFLGFFIGIVLGALMAYYEASRFDVSSTLISILLNSIPFYVAAIVLLYVFAYQLSLFPTGGRVDPDTVRGLNLSFFLGVLHHAILPIVSMVITGFGGVAVAMRGNSIQILGADYLHAARLRGLSERRLALQYVGRNAVLPMYTTFMISIGTVFGGSIILEEIFTYPGVGWYLFRSIGARDYPLMMGGFILITVAVVIGIYIADLTYGKIDPRAGSGGEEREAY